MSAALTRVWGMGAEFNNAQDLYHAAEQVRDMGFQRWDVHSPYPIHGMDHAMGLGPSRLSFFSLLGGILGFTTAVLMISLTSANYRVPEAIMWILSVFLPAEWAKEIYQNSIFTYPMIVHGKPYFAPEPSVPIFFELTVLFTAFFSVFAIMGLCQLPRWNHPLFNWDRFSRVTDDKFFLVIEASDPRFDEQKTREMLETLGGKFVTLIEE